MEQVSQFINQLQGGEGASGSLPQPLEQIKTIVIVVAVVAVLFWLLGIISDITQKRSIAKIRKDVKEINAKLDTLIADREASDN